MRRVPIVEKETGKSVRQGPFRELLHALLK